MEATRLGKRTRSEQREGLRKGIINFPYSRSVLLTVNVVK